jgi:hypothetical protein
MTHFGPDGAYAPELGTAPSEVDSVMNHKVINGKHIIAAVSGGVTVDPRSLGAPQAVKNDDRGLIGVYRRDNTPQALPRRAWWWD